MTTHADLPEAPEHSLTPQYPIESVDNALKLLWLVSEVGTLRLTDASRYLGVASSTAHRLLAMLQYRGFLAQDRSSRAYTTGPALNRIAFTVLSRIDVREQARPLLQHLAEDVGETVHLGRLEGAKVHFIDSIEGPRAVRVASRLGQLMPAHCTSTGKALLAQLTDHQIEELYPGRRLVKLTANSIGTRHALLVEVAAVRERGYATSDEESEEGVSSVAVAIASQAIAPTAVNVSAPTNRMTPAARESVVAAVTATTQKITSLLT